MPESLKLNGEDKVFNPDVLDCIANLSSDEVFTPPKLVNEILDQLPPETWRDSKITFLDPACKSGVWLREITKRLINGLADEIPDLQQRIDHILHKQVFGIAITELTSLLSRRSLYCSKYPNGKYSISHFDSVEGNIWFKNINHKWKNGKCTLCGASKDEYDRDGDVNNYAYGFIHCSPEYWEEVFGVKFDVIIGNPPYQLSDGGGTGDSAKPIYDKFVDNAKRLSPKHIVMIVPSRWMKGGKGLSNFRASMIADTRMEYLFDYEDASECFPGVHIDGGVCYFMWNTLHDGEVQYAYKPKSEEVITSKRYLGEGGFGTVIRDPRQISILKKSRPVDISLEFNLLVSAQKPYGFRADFFNSPERYSWVNILGENDKNSIKIYGVKGKKGGAKRTYSYVSRESVKRGQEHIDNYKLFFSKAYLTTSTVPPEIIVGKPGEVCTETFLSIGNFNTLSEAENCLSYIKTKFFRAILFFNRHSLNISRESFSGIPMQDFSKSWTDCELYKMYNLTDNEVAYIESMIKEMK